MWALWITPYLKQGYFLPCRCTYVPWISDHLEFQSRCSPHSLVYFFVNLILFCSSWVQKTDLSKRESSSVSHTGSGVSMWNHLGSACQAAPWYKLEALTTLCECDPKKQKPEQTGCYQYAMEILHLFMTFKNLPTMWHFEAVLSVSIFKKLYLGSFKNFNRLNCSVNDTPQKTGPQMSSEGKMCPPAVSFSHCDFQF